MSFVADERFIKIEKQKAREFRKSRWWQQKIQNCRCYYCDKPLTAIEVTMDHLVPISHGGYTTKNNVVPCCKDCNNKKKSSLPWDFKNSLITSGERDENFNHQPDLQ